MPDNKTPTTKDAKNEPVSEDLSSASLGVTLGGDAAHNPPPAAKQPDQKPVKASSAKAGKSDESEQSEDSTKEESTKEESNRDTKKDEAPETEKEKPLANKVYGFSTLQLDRTRTHEVITFRFPAEKQNRLGLLTFSIRDMHHVSCGVSCKRELLQQITSMGTHTLEVNIEAGADMCEIRFDELPVAKKHCLRYEPITLLNGELELLETK